MPGHIRAFLGFKFVPEYGMSPVEVPELLAGNGRSKY